MYCYCLFCETAKCQAIAREAEALLDCRAISPKQVQHTRSQGRMVDFVHDLLPGYVFLYLTDGPLPLLPLRRISGILKCLRNGDGTYELRGDDEQFALMLLEKGGVIGKTPVYQEGEMIRLKEGAFANVPTRILKVNRRNMRMQIEIPFANTRVKTWVEYEMVEKILPPPDICL